MIGLPETGTEVTLSHVVPPLCPLIGIETKEGAMEEEEGGGGQEEE